MIIIASKEIILMFTGIIESLGVVLTKKQVGTNLNLEIKSVLLKELKVDQSVAHNGVCLTVTAVHEDYYEVTLINETLKRTNFLNISKGDYVNLERCLKLGDRLDGHMVQGHIDQIGVCVGLKTLDGSWIFEFEYDPTLGNVTIEKGSICINGVSLTVVESKDGWLSVAIIPYTFENTIFKYLKLGDRVNLEFDVLGKYIKKITESYNKRNSEI